MQFSDTEPSATKKHGELPEPKSDIRSDSPSDFLHDEIIHGDIINPDQLQRHLTPRQVQFIAIGGAIGTALFVSIGNGLMQGAGSLLITYTIQALMMALVNNALAEMTIFMPVSAAFIQHASAWVDKAWGFMIGWSFFLFEGLLIPFEITALDMVLTYWRDDIPSAAVISVAIFFYTITNIFAVKYFGEAEFWLAGGKLILITILFCFTFITMVGGNPQRDAYGFRNWSKPAPFVEYLSTGDKGRLQGFLAALWQAAFTIVGPEYIASVAGETQRPTKTLKRAFKSVYWRYGVFFIGGALCCGIVLPANDPTLLRVLGSGETGTGAASPFVIAMNNMKIEGLPHVINALLLTSIYSAGNAYTYATSRSLYGLAQNGHAPKIFGKTTKNGVPIYALIVALAFACLSYLKLGSGSVQVLTWLTNLITGGTLVTYIAICVNYLFFYRALKVQGYDRANLPYCGYVQPYGTWIAMCWIIGIEIFYGYQVFLKGHWDIGAFFSHYTMAFLAICMATGWKLGRRTKMIPPEEADLVWARPSIERHEALMGEEEDMSIRQGFLHMMNIKKRFGRMITVPATTPVEYILAILERDGGVILKDLVSQDELSAIDDELKPWSASPRRHLNSTVDGDAFTTIPAQTVLVPGLVGKSKTVAQICEYPILEELRQRILREDFTVNREGSIEPNTLYPLLSLSVSMNIGYGAPRQLIHRDDNVHGIRHTRNPFIPWSFKQVSQFGCLIAGCQVTRENGATMFVPGSHRWDDERWARDDEVCFAEMTPGSALIFLASAYHGGGHNSVPDSVRTMHSLFFVRGNLRTEENQFLAIPRSKVREMSPKMLELLGYKKPTTALGIVDNMSPDEDVDGIWGRAAQ
ncbi:hypothetical protein BBP40_005608 [Aspergillus hancockii]|nr:hypothetical protein BBP40_005608 [Aspergillus hancockii]